MTLTFGSLFAGIGGFDLGFERAGMRCLWQVEIDVFCQRVLAKHWPEVKRYGDVRVFRDYGLDPVDVICGGDPCPIRSKARTIKASTAPDLSGYFLAVVGRLRPQWVVRENVPAPDDVWFDAALATLGYGTVIIRMDSSKITGQSRQRDFIIGKYQTSRRRLRKFFPVRESDKRYHSPKLETKQVIATLTTKRCRYESRDCYIYEQGRLRILDGDEREAFAGFPKGWTSGFSETARARFYGNAIVPQKAEWIGQRILEWRERVKRRENGEP